MKIAGIILGILFIVRLTMMLIWPTINDVKTGETPQYPDIQPQTFDQPYEPVFAAALEAAKEMGWDVTRTDSASGVI